MSPIFLAVLLAFLGLVAGYLVNQLPELKNFPGKNAFIWRVLAEVVALIIVSTTFGAISGQNDPKNADQLAWLARIEKGILVAGAILAFDCLLTGSTAWKHYTSGSVAGIDDKEQRLELLKSVSEDVRQRQRENFKNLEPQIVIPLGLEDVREEVGQSRFIATEDSQEPKAAQPILLRLKRFLRSSSRARVEPPRTAS